MPALLVRDASLSAVMAGFVTVLVGFTASGVLIFQAAQALGVDPRTVFRFLEREDSGKSE